MNKINVLKTIGASILATGLAACAPTDDEIAKVKAVMPPDCQIYYIGQHGEVSHLVVVRCEGKPLTTSNFEWHSGKVHHWQTVVEIG